MMSTESSVLTEEPSTSKRAAAAASAADTKKTENQEQIFSRYRSLILAEYGHQATTNEHYLKGMQNLRNELNYINETEWMFESLEKKAPQ